MRRRAILSLLLIMTLISNIGTAYALTVWDVVWETKDIVFNPLYWVYKEYNASQQLAQYIFDLSQVANWSYSTTKASLITYGSSYITYLYTVKDGSEYLKYYALARAKAVYIQELAKGSTPAEAMNKAVSVVDKIYNNKIKELIDHQNITVEFLEKTLPHYKQICDLYKYKYNITFDRVEEQYACAPVMWYITRNTTWCDSNYCYKVLQYKWGGFDYTFAYIKINNIEIYDYRLFEGCLNKLIRDKEWVIDNLVNYFTEVNQLSSGQLNVSQVADKVLDPYAIITMAQNDSANYYAWSAYELALLGLGTNLTAPIKIKVGDNTYEGYLFASDGFNTTLTVNGTYTVPDGESVYLLTPDGKIIVLQSGEQFKLLSATDEKTGRELQTITLEKYNSNDLVAQKLLEDVEKLIELYNITLQKTTTTGGGSSGDWAEQINDFWNNLDWQVKALIVGGGILVAIVLIGRAFGRGGVSIIHE